MPIACPNGLPISLSFLPSANRSSYVVGKLFLGSWMPRFLDQADAIGERGARVAVWNAVPLAVDRRGIDDPVVETAVSSLTSWRDHRLAPCAPGRDRPDVPHLDDVCARAPLDRGRDSRLQIRPSQVVGSNGDPVLATPFLGDLVEEVLALRNKVARLQDVELASLE